MWNGSNAWCFGRNFIRSRQSVSYTHLWHVDCVRKMSLNAFTCHYQNWCKRKKYNFSQSKAEEIYGKAKELVPVLPKDDLTKLIIKLSLIHI